MPMSVKVLSRPGDPAPLVKKNANIILIEDGTGTPICVAVTLGVDGAYCCAHADDPDFNAILQQLGFDKTTICVPADIKADTEDGLLELIKG